MKKYTWLFPFFSGIIAGLALLTPVAQFESYFSIWMWGLVNARLIENSLAFIDEQLIFFTGIGTSIAIMIFSLILIITGYLYRQRYFADKDLGKLWIGCGALILTSTIVSCVSLDYYTYDGYFPYGIWSSINPGFGAIGPILASIMAIGSGIFVSVTERNNRMRRKIIPLSTIAPKTLCPHCKKEISLNASFCSGCGKLLEN